MDSPNWHQLNLTVNLLFKRKKIIACNDKESVDFFLSMTKKHTCRLRTRRFAFFLPAVFQIYIPRKVLFKSECVMGWSCFDRDSLF